MLLIISCILGGYLVNQDYILGKLQNNEKAQGVVSSISKKLDFIKSYTGLFCIIVGIWSFFSPYYRALTDSFLGRQDFIGDLFPAVLSFLVGLMLSTELLGYINFSKDAEKSDERRGKLKSGLEKQKVLIGFLSILFGLLHIIDYIAGGYPLI